MTLSKIAKVAGVSVATVSKALANSKEISGETIDRVKRIAEELGYFEKRKRRRAAACQNPSPIIAVICNEIISVFYSAAVTAFSREVEKFGGSTIISFCDFSEKKLLHQVRKFSAMDAVDGIAVMAAHYQNIEASVPVVDLLDSYGNGNCDLVYSDYTQGMQRALEHLIGLGHTRIGFIGERLTLKKKQVFRDLLSRAGLTVDEDYFLTSDHRFEMAGYAAAGEAVKKGKVATAYLAAYDEVAIGALTAFNLNGYPVPERVSIIGMNDVSAAAHLEKPLTTVKSHIEEICGIAAGLLRKKISDKTLTAIQHIQVKSELVIRDTTAKRYELSF